MIDRVSKKDRSRMMAAVKGKDTKPEKFIRSMIFSEGFRYRIHVPNLPGKPDIVLPKYKSIIFVHGCFWHGHRCSRGRRPASNKEFWNKKLDQNIARDRKNISNLKKLGYRVKVIWECEIKNERKLKTKLIRFIENKG